MMRIINNENDSINIAFYEKLLKKEKEIKSMEEKKYLYHYTSIDTLLLILKNKTICFNSLINVDDLEECETHDIKKLGRFCYASCWTDSDEELIALWNMYTPNMQGVRIRLEQFPFVKYRYKKGEYYFKEETNSFIDYKKLTEDDKASIVSNCPILIKVIYTDDESLLFPISKNMEKKTINDGEKITNTQNISYKIDKIGKYKRKNWNFQNEVRYLISMVPWSMRELELCSRQKDFVKAQMELISRLEDENIKAPYDRFFLKLEESKLSEIEILLGPRVTEAQKEIVNLIVKEYCPTAKIHQSTLKIR